VHPQRATPASPVADAAPDAAPLWPSPETLKMPSAAPPSPDGGDDISASVIASAVSALAVATAAVAARFYTRAVIRRALAVEDWFVLAAWVSALTHYASPLWRDSNQ
jgi:hypothetical protein